MCNIYRSKRSGAKGATGSALEMICPFILASLNTVHLICAPARLECLYLFCRKQRSVWSGVHAITLILIHPMRFDVELASNRTLLYFICNDCTPCESPFTDFCALFQRGLHPGPVVTLESLAKWKLQQSVKSEKASEGVTWERQHQMNIISYGVVIVIEVTSTVFVWKA
jgi:hypothetical protein